MKYSNVSSKPREMSTSAKITAERSVYCSFRSSNSTDAEKIMFVEPCSVSRLRIYTGFAMLYEYDTIRYDLEKQQSNEFLHLGRKVSYWRRHT